MLGSRDGPSPCLAAALDYAGRGLWVFPVKTADKSPYTEHGFQDAAIDPKVIEAWWKKWPGAGVAIASGRSGLVVVDVDDRHAGDDSLVELQRELGPFPDTACVSTPGGQHYYFRNTTDQPIGCRNRLRPGIDIKSAGGYCVAPPTIRTDGGIYEWDLDPEDYEIAAVPDTLVNLIQARRTSSGPADLGRMEVLRNFPIDERVRRARKYVAKLPGAVSGEGGHDATFKAALVVVRGFVVDEFNALGILRQHFNSRCSPPWSDKELMHKVRSASAGRIEKDGGATAAPWGYLLISDRHAPEESTNPHAPQRPISNPSDSDESSPTHVLRDSPSLDHPSAKDPEDDRDEFEKRLKADGFHLAKKTQRPAPSQHNIILALRLLGVRLRHDAFANRDLVDNLEGFGPHLDDPAVIRLRLLIDNTYRFLPPKEFFFDIVRDQARHHVFHPVLDYLAGLTWDRTDRLNNWLSTYGGADESDYVHAVGRLILIAAVRRVRQPGCKFDEMLILESSTQGTEKSSALQKLAVNKDWFTDDLPLNADSKRQMEALSGRWIVEAAELSGMGRGQVEALKSSLSRQVDRARLSYGRLVTNAPRQCVIIGTTNANQYLKDSTGNRRFWPVTIRQFDLAALAKDRDQLWAEAAYYEALGESIRLDRKLYDRAADEQADRRVEDPFLETLSHVLGDLKGKLRATDAWTIVGVPEGLRTQIHNARLGESMRELGWERTRLRFKSDDDGSPAREYAYVRGTDEERATTLTVRKSLGGQVSAHLTDVSVSRRPRKHA